MALRYVIFIGEKSPQQKSNDEIPPMTQPVHVLVLLHVREGCLEGLQYYERAVVPIMGEHEGRLLSAFRPQGGGENGQPDEVHLIEFASESSFDAYRCVSQ